MTPHVTTEPAKETSLAIDVVPTGDGGEPRLRFRGRNGSVLEVTGNLAHLQQLASAAITQTVQVPGPTTTVTRTVLCSGSPPVCA